MIIEHLKYGMGFPPMHLASTAILKTEQIKSATPGDQFRFKPENFRTFCRKMHSISSPALFHPPPLLDLQCWTCNVTIDRLNVHHRTCIRHRPGGVFQTIRRTIRTGDDTFTC